MATNQIATGAVVLVASADQMVAGLDQAKARVDRWGKQVEASVQATSARTANLMDGMRAQWAANEQRKAESLGGLMSGKMAAFKAEPLKQVQLQNQKEAAGLLATIENRSASAAGSVQLLTGKLGELASGFAATNLAGGAMVGTLLKLNTAALEAGVDQAVMRFDNAAERLKKNQNKLQEVTARFFAEDERRALGADLSSWSGFAKNIETATKSLEGTEKELEKFRKMEVELERREFGRSFTRRTFGMLPGLGSVFAAIDKQDTTEIKGGIADAEARLDALRKHIEAMKGAALFGLLKNEVAPPIVAGLDQFMERFKAFTNLVVGNSKAIREATSGQLRDLESQYATIGMTPAASAVELAKRRGETDVNKLNEIALFEEAKARKQVNVNADEQYKLMQREALMYGMTAEQAKRYSLVLDGVDATRLENFDRLAEHMEQLKQMTTAASSAAAAPKLAAAMEAGSTEAYGIALRLKGFDIGDGNATAKESKQLLEDIKKLNEDFFRKFEQSQGLVAGLLRNIGAF